MTKTCLKRRAFDDYNDVSWVGFGFRNSGVTGRCPILQITQTCLKRRAFDDKKRRFLDGVRFLGPLADIWAELKSSF